MSCTNCLRGSLSPLTARLLSRAPGQRAAWKSFPKTQFNIAASKSAPTLSPKRREGWGTQVPVLPANPHRINPFQLTPLNGIFCDKRLVLNILRAYGGRGYLLGQLPEFVSRRSGGSALAIAATVAVVRESRSEKLCGSSGG